MVDPPGGGGANRQEQGGDRQADDQVTWPPVGAGVGASCWCVDLRPHGRPASEVRRGVSAGALGGSGLPKAALPLEAVAQHLAFLFD